MEAWGGCCEPGVEEGGGGEVGLWDRSGGEFKCSERAAVVICGGEEAVAERAVKQIVYG